jgi:hypothetical protein
MRSAPGPTSGSPYGNHARTRWLQWSFAGCVLTLLCFGAISHDSFWIDECVTAQSVRHATLAATWREVLANRFSEVQMPFYVSYMWGYARCFGLGEFVMRLAGVPFFVIGIVLLMAALGTRRACSSGIGLLVAAGLSPFAWYYLNEARPYAMQLGIAAMVAAAIFRLTDPDLEKHSASRWLKFFFFNAILLSGVSMLGQLWVGGALLILLAVTPRERLVSWWKMHRTVWLLSISALLLIGSYYLWSLTLGARATTVGKTNLQTMVFIAYEQLGFMGSGPGRNELRTTGVSALKPFWAGLAVYGLVVGGVFAAGLIRLWQKCERRKLLIIAVCLAVPAVMILAAGVVTHFRVLGRHFTPFAIVLLIILGVGLSDLWRRGWAARGLTVAFSLACLWSCLEVRFAPRHQKDNYREAARLAKAALAEEQTVWWNADPMAAAYYGVATVDAPEKRTSQYEAVFVASPGPEFAARWSAPAMVIASKVDIYDAQGTLAAYLNTHGYWQQTNLMAFTVWQASR